MIDLEHKKIYSLAFITLILAILVLIGAVTMGVLIYKTVVHLDGTVTNIYDKFMDINSIQKIEETL